MLVRAKFNLYEGEIKKGAFGIAVKNDQLNMSLKALNVYEKEELLKLLGDKAKKFLNIHRVTHRIIIDRSGIKYDLGIALPIYDVEGLGSFEEIKFSDLSKEDKKKLRDLENKIHSEE